MIDISQIQWRRISASPSENVLGMCTIVLEDQLVINEVRVIRGHDRIFVAYPNKEYDSRDHSGAVYPIRDALRRLWEQKILDDFERAYMNFFQK